MTPRASHGGAGGRPITARHTGGVSMGIDLTLIVSADSHVNEPHDLWFDRLPAGVLLVNHDWAV